MLRHSRPSISDCTRSAIALVALAAAGAARAQEAKPQPAPLGPAPQQEERGKARPAVVIPFKAAPNPNNEPNLADLVEENRQEYRALLISELQFCRNACDLTDEQCRQIARRSGPIVAEAASWAAKLELKPAQRGGIRLATDPVPPNAIKLTRDILLKIVKSHTTPAQQARYQVELEKRAAHQKYTAIHYLVARLDRILILSSDQRSRLVQLFEKNWDDEWAAIVTIMDDDGASFPAIPHRLILPMLSPTQQKVLKRCDQQAVDATDVYMSTVFEFVADLPSDIRPWLDAAEAEQATKPPAEGEAPARQNDASVQAAP